MNEKKSHDAEETVEDRAADQALALELEFAPAWARRPPDRAHHYADKPGRSRPGPRDRDKRDRPGKGRQRRQPPAASARGYGPAGKKSPGKGPGRRSEQTSRESRRERPSVVPLPPVDVRFLPAQRQLSVLLKKIRLTGRAYPLVRMASLFLTNPTTCDVRIEVRPDASDVNILQCGKCGIVAMERASLLAHITAVHTEDYFEKEEQIQDPPSGTFVCMARCGLSGTLLGPPNHHSFETKAREVQRARYPNMSFAQYKDKCEQLHDQDLIEKWKEESRKQTVYRMKSSPESEPITRNDVEAYMSENVAPELISSSRRCDVNAAVAREEIKDQGLRGAVNAAWRRESAFPKDISGALRGAFRHGNLYVFRSGRGRQIFVTATRPVPMDRSHIVESIRAALSFIETHPGCSRKDIVKVLHPGLSSDSPEARSTLSPLRWLIERGHIIEFFDNSLAVPSRAAPPQKGRKDKKGKKRR